MIGCFTADPPWMEHGSGKVKRGADRHYPLLTTDQIIGVMSAVMREHRPAPSSHLWLWVTDNFLLDGARVIDALGYRYVRTFVWVKTKNEADEDDDLEQLSDDDLQQGLGQYARGSHELCLFATRGNARVPPPGRRPKSVILSRRGEHSAKPEACYGRWFERVSEGPFLEMFARSRRPGWQSWGLEADARLIREMSVIRKQQGSLFA